jgi:hypothetical protein
MLSVGFASKLIKEINPKPKLPPELSPIVINFIFCLKIMTGTTGTKIKSKATIDESFISPGKSNGNRAVISNKKKKPYAIKYLSGFAKTNMRTAMVNTIPQNIIELIIPISNEDSTIIPIAKHENKKEPAKVVANIFRANLATT